MCHCSFVVRMSLSAALIVSLAQPARAQFYAQHNLVSDGAVPADLVDPNLVNAWGLVSSPTSPWWVSDNGTGRSTLYRVNTGTIPLIVTRSEEHTSELQSPCNLVCRLLLEKKKKK